MQPNGYATSLRQLRALELRQNTTLQSQADEVVRLRLATIDNGPGTPEQKQALRDKATLQYNTFMQREYVPPVPEEPIVADDSAGPVATDLDAVEQR